MDHIISPFDSKRDLENAKTDVDNAINEYTASMGYLTAKMGAILLEHNKTQRRAEVLEWLSSNNYWQRHKELQEQRTPDTGK